MWMCVCVGFVKCGCVYVWGFCNVWVCVCVGFIKCVRVCLCVGFIKCVCVCFVMCRCFVNMCTCTYCVFIVSFMYIYSYLLLV